MRPGDFVASGLLSFRAGFKGPAGSTQRGCQGVSCGPYVRLRQKAVDREFFGRSRIKSNFSCASGEESDKTVSRTTRH
jgi:hypothetical protein